MRVIPLTQGKQAVVDDEDFDLLMGMGRWCAMKLGGKFYAYKGKWLPSEHRTRHIAMHRLLCGLVWGDPRVVDHINGDGLDNRRANLRVCSRAQNQANGVGRTRTSRFKGVSLDMRSGKWLAQCKRNKWLGRFSTEHEAAIAYNRAALFEFGEFARLNSLGREGG